MKGTLKSLADMQKLPEKEFPFRKQVLVFHVLKFK
jgi:hypothetical protein